VASLKKLKIGEFEATANHEVSFTALELC